ncbi:MAG: D-2-hydroxyacid dehydrogenase [Paenibacillus sp.]|jgi:phosphoglycerate dehydrogenase-like enzyme|nr:D-2-hydroxyacid dehydrogenase [Paenibacillus sp.]
MKIVVTLNVKKQWTRIPGNIEWSFCGADTQSINEALTPDTDVLVTDVMPTNISACSGLKWLHLMSAGTEQLISHPLMERELRLSNAAGIGSVHMAEFVVAQLLRHRKRFDALAAHAQERRWPNRLAESRPSLRGGHALIIGYGGVGRETARLLTAFGMSVTAVQSVAARQTYHGYMPYPDIGDPEGLLPKRIVTAAELHSVLPEADVVILAVPLTGATVHLMNREAFDRMKPDAVLINVSRGRVVDTVGMLEALDAGVFAHAYLDVFDVEPLRADSPLWTHPGVTATPHMSGVMPDSAHLQQDLLLRNLERYQRGEKLINELDRNKFMKP